MQFFNKILTMKTLSGIAAAALLAVLAGCGEKAGPQAPPPPQVSAVTAHSATVPVTYEYPGRVAGYEETEVRARVGGILLKRNFIEGEKVAEGQLLFEIDPSVYEAAVAQQKGVLAQAKANYAQSVLDANRAEELWKKGYQSTAYRDQMAAKRDANQAAVQQAEGQLRQAELNLEYTKVTAPISGITGVKHVSEGSLIAADASSNLLTTITQTDPVYINFSYAGRDAKEIRGILADMRAENEKTGALKVRIRFGNGQDYDKLGTVDFTSPTIDQNTGALNVRAIVANPDSVLVPGEFVRLILEGLEFNHVIAIPEQSLMQDSGGQFVYVISPQNEVEKRAVVAFRQLANRDWLLKPGAEEAQPAAAGAFAEPDAASAAPQTRFVGLRDGEKIITEGQFRIGNALAALPKGVALKVNITALDGKNTAPASGAAQGK